MPEQFTQSQQGNLPQNPPPYYPQRKKRRWWIPVLIIGLIFFFIILPIIAVFGLVGSVFEEHEVVVKKNSILVVDLTRPMDEFSKVSPFQEIFGDKGGSSFNDVLRAVERAEKDDRINGIYLKGGPGFIGYARSIELMNKLDEFKQSGKFIYSFIQAANESGYFRTLPADKIFMPKEGFVELNGFGIEAMFMKGLFKKLGIEFYVEHFEDFKSAGETLNRRNFSDSAKFEYREILDQRNKLFIAAVSKYRKLNPDFINNVLNRGVYEADSLLAYGFVDSLMNETDFRDMLKALSNSKIKSKKKKKKLRVVSVGNYLKADYKYDKRKIVKDKRIAIIYAEGAIVDAEPNKFSDQKQITKKLAKYIRKAREDKKIKAIILRVNSPGGSVMASDEIWKEVVKTQGVKPIYASMGDVAASGGYYISMACDTIIAHPATITGSIGVIAALPNLSGTWKKLDISFDTISTSPAAHDLSLNYPFNQRQKDKLHNMIKKMYYRFITKVANGRKMEFEQAHALAKGRVWTGEQAKEKGLVDVLGGLDDAIKIAKARIGVGENERVYIVQYPRKEEPFEALVEMFTGGDDDEDVSINKSLSEVFASGNSDYAMLYKSLPYSMQLQLNYARTLFEISRKEHFMYALPYYITIN